VDSVVSWYDCPAAMELPRPAWKECRIENATFSVISVARDNAQKNKQQRSWACPHQGSTINDGGDIHEEQKELDQ
jgi:hypothetical protein